MTGSGFTRCETVPRQGWLTVGGLSGDVTLGPPPTGRVGKTLEGITAGVILLPLVQEPDRSSGSCQHRSRCPADGQRLCG
jgi:hypothetical protein